MGVVLGEWWIGGGLLVLTRPSGGAGADVPDGPAGDLHGREDDHDAEAGCDERSRQPGAGAAVEGCGQA